MGLASLYCSLFNIQLSLLSSKYAKFSSLVLSSVGTKLSMTKNRFLNCLQPRFTVNGKINSEKLENGIFLQKFCLHRSIVIGFFYFFPAPHVIFMTVLNFLLDRLQPSIQSFQFVPLEVHLLLKTGKHLLQLVTVFLLLLNLLLDLYLSFLQ